MASKAEGFDSPERAALAQAIATLREFDADAAAQDSAIRTLNARRLELFAQREEAEAAIEKARAATIEHLVATARGSAGTAPETAAQARARFEDLDEQYEATKAVVAGLEARKNQPGAGRGSRVAEVKSAARAVLAMSPALHGMMEEVEELAERFLRKATTLAAVASMGIDVPGLRRGQSSQVLGRWYRGFEAMKEYRVGEAEVLADPAWSIALANLRMDANASLPDGGKASTGTNVAPLERRG